MRKLSIVTFFLVAIGVFYLYTNVEAASCGETCTSAKLKTPSSHSGSHTCGGNYTEIAVAGYCSGSGTSCETGTGQLYRGVYGCEADGDGCKHTKLDTSAVNVTDC